MNFFEVVKNGNDEFYTPRYAVKPILKHLKCKKKIWCPFDTEDSNFVKMLKEEGHEVVATSLLNDQDFFEIAETKVADWAEVIISNPPYSLKTEVLDKLFEIGKPFAMLLGCVGIFESQKRFNMFKNNDFELLIMNKRIDYFKNYNDQKPSKNPPFSSWYICSKLLDQKIIFQEIDKKDI